MQKKRLNLDDLSNKLLKTGLISSQQQKQLFATKNGTETQLAHPLLAIADHRWKSANSPSIALNIETLTKWLAEQNNIEYYRIDPLKIDVQSITGIISQTYAKKLKVLPIEINTKTLTVAVDDPYNTGWEDEISRLARRDVKRVLINPLDLERYTDEFFGVSRSLTGAFGDKTNNKLSSIQNFEQMVELGKTGEPDANDSHIVNIADWLLQFAFEQRASDIHLEPRRGKGHARFRIDGVLNTVHEFPDVVFSAITSRLKSLGRMDVTDRRRPQDGRVKTKTPEGQEVEMRISSMPTAFGEKLVLRIFNPKMLKQDYKHLGFSSHETEQVKNILSNPHGIFLVTGPTGSGKTTTLYSMLNQLARPEINICTIEDPIEMVDENFNQMQVQSSIGVDFASGVRTLLRQDPDVIMVGEIRDKETAEIAIQAALTGHLVLSTMHTNDSPSSVTRLFDLGIQPFLISSTLLGVLAQRLIRSLCPHCLTPIDIDPSAWKSFTKPYKITLPKKANGPTGCDECRNTGYLGRIGLYEILSADNVIKQAINERVELNKLTQLALEQGLRPLKVSGIQKVIEGITTMEEVYSVLPAES